MGNQNEGIPLKQEHKIQTLTIYYRLMKFSEYVNIEEKQNLTKFGDTVMGAPRTFNNQDQDKKQCLTSQKWAYVIPIKFKNKLS